MSLHEASGPIDRLGAAERVTPRAGVLPELR